MMCCEGVKMLWDDGFLLEMRSRRANIYISSRSGYCKFLIAIFFFASYVRILFIYNVSFRSYCSMHTM